MLRRSPKNKTLYNVGAYVTYNTFVQIDFSLDSDSEYHEDQEKKGLHFFIDREKV